MSFAALVDRVREDFLEIADLELTLPQAVRLWQLGPDDCRVVVDALVDAGFLKWTARRTIVRAGGESRGSEDWSGRAHVSVRASRRRDNSVGRD